MPVFGEVSALVAAWYLASCVAITTSKLCMTAVSAPFVLCSTQCATAMLATRLQLYASGAASALRRPAEAWATARVSAGYSAGFALTNAAFALASAPFVETVKAAEPVSTALLAVVMLGERERSATYFSLLPIVVGVALATGSSGAPSSSTSRGGDALFSVATLVVLLSNVCFSLRAVYVKALKKNHPGSAPARSAVSLFYHVSRYGLPAFVALAVVRGDLGRLAKALFPATRGPDDDDDAIPQNTSPRFLVFALLANGVAYTTYNMASFMVLARVSTTTHAVLNVFRRVVVIAVTTLYFQTPITASGLAGVLTAAFGVAVYATSKQQHASISGKGKAASLLSASSGTTTPTSSNRS